MHVLSFVAGLVVLLVAVCARLGSATLAHPECRYTCDDPVCLAKCYAVCMPPRCQMQCQAVNTSNGHPVTVHCAPPVCRVRCPVDQVEGDTCPACETICEPVACTPVAFAHCSPLCEQTACHWTCVKPTPGRGACPMPRCEIQCEAPACWGPAAAGTNVTVIGNATFSAAESALADFGRHARHEHSGSKP